MSFNVIHISTQLSWRGGEQQLAYIVEELSKKGDINQSVLCPKGSAIEQFCIKNQYTYHSFDRGLFYRIRCALKLKKLCEIENTDIVHAHDGHAVDIVAFSSFLFRNKTSAVLHRRVFLKVKHNFFSRYKYNQRNVKKIFCVSNAVLEILKPSLKQPEKAVVIYSCIDTEKFKNVENKHLIHSKFQISESIKLVGNISAIADPKDYFTFVDVAEIVCEQLENVRFIIVGEGNLKQEIESYIHSKNLEEKVLLTGFRKDIPEIFSELDVFLITSKTEGLGTTILDSFASATPVVATNAGGIPEIVKHEETGLLAGVSDSTQLAENVMRLLEDEELCNRVKINALLFSEKFSKKQLGENIANFYRQICQ